MDQDNIKNRTKASLRIFTRNIPPARISEFLHAAPTESYELGSLVSQRLPSGPRRDSSLWLLESTLPETSELNEHIDSLVSFMEQNVDGLRPLRSQCTFDIFCGFFSEKSQGGFGLSVQLMKRLADLDVELIFDIYGHVEGPQQS